MALHVESEKYEEGMLPTKHGAATYRWYAAPGSTRAAIWVGGVGGGWDTPAQGLYPKLCEKLTQEGIASMRIRFRNARNFAESVIDVRAAVDFCGDRDIDTIALIGHSFGGAVVIAAAAAEPSVRTVITIATQTRGAESVADLSPACSILLIHGLEDNVLPWRSSEHVHTMAEEPKHIAYVVGAGHMLDESATEVEVLVRDWLVKELIGPR